MYMQHLQFLISWTRCEFSNIKVHFKFSTIIMGVPHLIKWYHLPYNCSDSTSHSVLHSFIALVLLRDTFNKPCWHYFLRYHKSDHFSTLVFFLVHCSSLLPSLYTLMVSSNNFFPGSRSMILSKSYCDYITPLLKTLQWILISRT